MSVARVLLATENPESTPAPQPSPEPAVAAVSYYRRDLKAGAAAQPWTSSSSIGKSGPLRLLIQIRWSGARSRPSDRDHPLVANAIARREAAGGHKRSC